MASVSKQQMWAPQRISSCVARFDSATGHLCWTITGLDSDGKAFTAESANYEQGGNGLVILAHGTAPERDFVLKSNIRFKQTVAGPGLQEYFSRHMLKTTQPLDVDSLTVDANGVLLVLYHDTYHAVFAVGDQVLGHRPCPQETADLAHTASDVTLVAGGSSYSQLISETSQAVQQLPWVCGHRSRRGTTYTLETVGPARLPMEEPLTILKSKPRPAVLEAINGPGILPNAVRVDNIGQRWLIMPLARGGTLGNMHRPGGTLISNEKIFRELCRAAVTCLTQPTPRFMGDFKPENIVVDPACHGGCKVIDVDWVPSWRDCMKFGGPRFWATFQISKESPWAADYETTPTMMVLHSLLVTAAALAAPENLKWVYANAAHKCKSLPHTTREALIAMPNTGYSLFPRLLTAASEVTGQLTVERLVRLLLTAIDKTDLPQGNLKRKRLD